ncbi:MULTISPECIES: bifunctional 2',3'-cyclic-nucleotide 2'-phosphodiesterase/3'-nucleotidase [Lysinibacillus]|uniref:bifunctional 2',3'-cyclic-nucleotide 2'-phosphodiesterase/3'-nucleotidase n=1 Tax=Lysinibacillus TaxID=400634 RepID=UPI001C8B9B58|nr:MULTISPECIES: bifunctional 2',3'-cyclic-nucleotide 2'-phosphodiesterase/3'-nucleotidase [Lysinibacillus]MBX8945104.1 bifunctional 2',3'-cyclic-nucleotide 2'-phosphodiesterase/3'-nucleotidase [Lysinibacillus sp. K60]WHP41050.1 bifunctional 2',3'-cyclic-nucleotide 2'-phosphodiesterase/3'-nucleotidase [Lysinibacillus boronitolerans]
MYKKLITNFLTTLLVLFAFIPFGISADAASNDVTRADYVKELVENLDVEIGDGSSLAFKDVSKDLAPYVEKAVQLKLIKGKTATTFGPDDKLTRQQAFVISARGLVSENASLTILEQFKDADQIAAAYKQDLANAVAANILQAFEDNTIRPHDYVTKEQMESIVERFVAEYKAPSTDVSVDLQILGTTDIHTNLANYNYYLDAPSAELGLANTATLIEQARAKNPNTLLFDNGDLIQGTPLGSYKALESVLKPGEVHPAIAALNALKYDGGTLGNHEFNYGLDFLDEVLNDAKYPVVNANTYDAKTKERMFTPYVILDKGVVDSSGEKHTLKVGVTGIVPTKIVEWDAIHLAGKVEMQEPVEAIKEVVPEMQKAGADVIVVLSHSGIGEDTYVKGAENVGYQLAEIDGIDALITGHSHLTFPGDYKDLKDVDQEKGTIHGVPTVMAGSYGSHLGVIDLKLEQQGSEWVVVDGKGSLQSIKQEGLQPSTTVLEAIKEAHDGTLTYIRQPVGETTAPIHSYFSMVQDDPSIQIVTQAQKWFIEQELKGTADEKTPILSAGAPFKAGSRNNPLDYTNIPVGPLAIKNMADIYHYDNTVATIKVTGAQAIEWLEMAAGIFATIDPTKTEEQNIIDAEARSYNFDVLDGLTYQIDVTSPAKYDRRGNLTDEKANRIKNVQYNGKPIDLKQEFIIITNNYRVGGSYGATFKNADGSNITNYAYENRQAVVDYIMANKTINPAADNNWSFVSFPANTKVIYLSAKDAQKFIPVGSGIEYLEDTEAGFAKYLIK